MPAMPLIRSHTLLLSVAISLLFLSSFLLFAIQPLIGRMTLPLLGAAPTIWVTAVLFFQITLALAYMYVDIVTRYTSLSAQMSLHFSLMVAALLSLPLSLGVLEDTETAVATSMPVLFLLQLYILAIGLPFFVNATTAPLLQKWFSYTRHAHARDPFFLYASSNAGSLCALVAYVVIIDPSLTIPEQSHVWSVAFIVFMVGVAVFALFASTHTPLPPTYQQAQSPSQPAPPPSITQRMAWCLYAFLPSSLLLSTSVYITTDIAAIPFLWVLPFILYLLTFIIAFARKQRIGLRLILHLHTAFAILYALTRFANSLFDTILSIGIALGVLFSASLLCHHRLFNARPAPDYLGQFYVWLAVGGALGGLFNVVLAPLLFDSLIDYAIIIILICLFRPAQIFQWRAQTTTAPSPPTPHHALRLRLYDVIIPLALCIILAIAIHHASLNSLVAQGFAFAREQPVIAIPVIIWSLILISMTAHRPLRFALTLACFAFPPFFETAHNVENVFEKRNFFGVYRIVKKTTEEGSLHLLRHGTTIHGGQWLDEEKRTLPAIYYEPSSPFGAIFRALRKHKEALSVGVLGLGAGTIACYATDKDRFTFFELDPLVAQIAQDDSLFTFVRTCAPEARLQIGDARLSLQQEDDASYDLLIIDVFSSDAIPVHLLTEEAIDMYFQKLAPHGVMLFHTSNRYLDISLPLISYTASHNIFYRQTHHIPTALSREKYAAETGSFVLMAQSDAFLGDSFTRSLRWEKIPPPPYIRPWTDNYANVLATFLTSYTTKKDMLALSDMIRTHYFTYTPTPPPTPPTTPALTK
ncbi:MAG: fused MFS/spermidine synthase [Alphaproteobacteria bacterium GM7ARS4]|nr:fused MFS/spermidine synthase [Alphaproteobacteria bacterium GM7ARS4]